MTTHQYEHSADESSPVFIDNPLLFEAVVAVEIAATRDPSWQRAFTRAARELMCNPVEFDGSRLYASSSRNPHRVYAASAIDCQCEGYTFGRGRPCWHMAGARLMRRYHEAAACAAGRV